MFWPFGWEDLGFAYAAIWMAIIFERGKKVFFDMD